MKCHPRMESSQYHLDPVENKPFAHDFALFCFLYDVLVPQCRIIAIVTCTYSKERATFLLNLCFSVLKYGKLDLL